MAKSSTNVSENWVPPKTMMLNNHVTKLHVHRFSYAHTCSYIFIHCHYHFPHSMDLKDGIAPSVRHTPKWLTASLRATWMESCSARSLQLWHLLRLTLWWKIQNGWEKPGEMEGVHGKIMGSGW